MYTNRSLEKNLWLIHAREKSKRKMNMNGASISVASMAEAQELTQALYEEKTYEDIVLEFHIENNSIYHYSVTIWWKENE